MGLQEGTLILWKSTSCTTCKVVRGDFSLIISFIMLKEKVFQSQGSNDLLRFRGGKTFLEELENLFGYCGFRWCEARDLNTVCPCRVVLRWLDDKFY